MVALALLLSGCGKKGAKEETGGTISISGAFALYPVTIRWAEEYKRIEPGLRIDVSAGGAGKGMADVLAGMVDIAMVSRAVQDVEKEKGAWGAAVAKDAVVPVINEQNPVLSTLLVQGVTRDQFMALWLNDQESTWEELMKLGANQKSLIRVYTRSDSCGAAETWAQYLGKKQEHLKGIGVYGDPGLAQAVRKDPQGIGYNNVNYAYDATTKKPVAGLTVLPIDLDGNGVIDPTESFYSTRDDLIAAISDGRYPSPPARELYFVCKGIPERPVIRRFINWVLNAGQAYLGEAGYIAPAATSLQTAKRILGE